MRSGSSARPTSRCCFGQIRQLLGASASARLARSRRNGLGDVDHSQDEESSPDYSAHLIFLEGGTVCDWLRDSVCHLLAPALQPRLSEFSHRSHVHLLVCWECPPWLPGSTALHTPSVARVAVVPQTLRGTPRPSRPPRCRKCSATWPSRPSALPRRFHSIIPDSPSARAVADIPLPKRPHEDAPGRTRTCDPLLRSEQQVLQSTAAPRQDRSASDGPHITAAFHCGPSLPGRFH